jgi:hypothetical protein
MEPDAIAALIPFLIQPTNPWVATVSISNAAPDIDYELNVLAQVTLTEMIR